MFNQNVYTHPVVTNLCKRLPQNTDKIITLYENFGVSVENLGKSLEVVTINTYLKNLKCHSVIKSIESPPLPQYELTDSESDRLTKTLQVEWGSERKHLDVYVGLGDSEWMNIGSASLLAPFMYPFRIHNLLDLFTDNLAAEFGIGSRIGVAIADVGYGLLDFNDSVVIHGSLVTEIVTTNAVKVAITSSKTFNFNPTATSQVVLKANPDRKQVTVTNAGTKPAYLNFSTTARTREGIYVSGNNGTYEYNTDNYAYFGDISCVCLEEHESEVFLVGMEAS